MTSVPCHVRVGGRLYDVTQFSATHPGGVRVLQSSHMRDVSAYFLRTHSDRAKALLHTLPVVEEGLADSAGPTQPASAMVAATTDPVLPPAALGLAGAVMPADGGDSAAAWDDGIPTTAAFMAEPHDLTDVLLHYRDKVRQAANRAARKHRYRQPSSKKRAAGVPGAGYASKWHLHRRCELLRTHPTIERDLLDRYRHDPWTLVTGVLATAMLALAAFSWVPSVGWRRSSPSTTWSYTACLMRGPPCFFLPGDPLGDYLVPQVIWVILLAYTVGAFCKMSAFAVSHELCHGTVAKCLTPGPEDDQPLGGDHYRVPWQYLLQDACLRMVNAVSLTSTVYEYYHNQHLAHHRFLGSLDAAQSLVGFYDGTQSGDGDQLAVNTLLMAQRWGSSMSVSKPVPPTHGDDSPRRWGNGGA